MNDWIPILAPAVTAAGGAWAATWFAQRRARADRRAELAESVLANAYRCRDALRRYLTIRHIAPIEHSYLGELSSVAAEADQLQHRFRTIFGSEAASPLELIQISRDVIVFSSKEIEEYANEISEAMAAIDTSIKLLEIVCRREIPDAKSLR